MAEIQQFILSSSQVSDFMQQTPYLPLLITDTIPAASAHRLFQEKPVP
jgi:hypothetical protein